MENLKKLKKYFREGSAEKENSIRNVVFVQTQSVKKLIQNLDENFIILKSPKGTGKSSILDELHDEIINTDGIGIKITPKDLDVDAISKKQSNSDKENEAEWQLTNIIYKHFLSYTDYCDLNSEEASWSTFVDKLVNDFTKSRTANAIIQKILPLVPGNEKMRAALRNPSSHSSHKNFIHTDMSAVLRHKERKVLVFIDDVDLAGSSHNESVNYEASWAIIAAAYNLTCELMDISIIVSIRTDIWHTMKIKKLGTDKRDKITKILGIDNTENDMKDILKKRIFAAENKSNIVFNELLKEYFEGEMILPGEKGESRPWVNWICKQSRERPRDLIQFVKMLIDKALETNSSKIKPTHATSILVEFGRTRVSNIADEFSNICPQIDPIFRRLDKVLFNYDEVTTLLKKIPSAFTVSVDGNTLQPNQIESAIYILKVLHMANIINPREEFSDGRYNHLSYTNNEDLISLKNISTLQKYKYEVHPVFHSVILASKKN